MPAATPTLKSATAFIALTAALLTGCGFHLRGELDLGASRFYISGDDLEMVAELTAALTQHGAVVVNAIDASNDAPGAARIDLRAGRFDRATLTTDARGRANAHQIRYTVEFSVHAAGQDGGARAHTVTLSRAMDYDPARQLQSEIETRFLESAMRQEAATRIMQFLARR